MPKIRKVVVWDIDGPINHGLSSNPNECYLPEGRYEASKPGNDPSDFIVDNRKMLKLTMNILQENRVSSVIGSQRIQMQEEDPDYGRFVRAMYRGLDHVFGEDRLFLKEDIAKKIGQSLQGLDLNKIKNPIMQAYQAEFQLGPQDVFLIDDSAIYGDPAKSAGFAFVYAPRRKALNTLEHNTYLYETLLQTIGVDDIAYSIEHSDSAPETKNFFKQQLCLYQQEHLQDVISWQAKLITERKPPEDEKKAQPVGQLQKEAARHVLQGIQYLIIHTKWNLGYFGGVNILEKSSGVKNKIPKGMAQILDEIQAAQEGKQSLDQALENVERIVADSSARKGHFFFNRRDEATQVFYDEFKKRMTEIKGEEPTKGADKGEKPTI